VPASTDSADLFVAVTTPTGIVRSFTSSSDDFELVVGAPLGDALPDATRPTIDDAVERAREGHSRTLQLETHTTERITLTITPMVADDGGALLVRATNTREAQTLRMTRHALDRVGEAILWVAADGSIRYSNRAASNYLGYTRDELTELSVPDINPGFQRERWQESWTMLFGAPSSKFETVHRTKAGTLIPVEVTVNPFEFEGEQLVFAFIQEVASRKKLEAEAKAMRDRLAQQQKLEAVEALAGGIAHDFNNILAGIVGFAELGMLDAPSGTIRDSLDEILRASDRARVLVARVLASANPNKPTTNAVRLKSIVEEALSLLRAAAPATVEFVVEFEDDGVVECDPTALHQVVMNLGTNAIRAMPEGGRLSVRLGRASAPETLDGAPATACLTIADTGCGIDPESIEHIFEPFFTTREGADGTGLGLAVVEGVVRDSGGAVRVESEVGEGTTFTVLLPLLSTSSPTEAREPQTATGGSETVLLVDDEHTYRTATGRFLRRVGYRVIEAANGAEALEALIREGTVLEAMVTDMNMPGMAPGVFLDRVRALRPDLPVVVCSGFTSPSEHERVIEAGVQAFLAKPVRQRELGRTLRRVLDTGTVFST